MGQQPPPRHSLKQHLIVWASGIGALLYLINPLGPFDLIPDAIPFIGNLDDATAVLILVNVLRFYGIDALRWFDYINAREADNVVEGTVVESETVDSSDA